MSRDDSMKSDRGFSLIELLVSSALAVLVLSIVGGMVISAISTERTVKQSTTSSNVGQLAASSITHGVRASSKLHLSAPAAGTQVLRALVVDDVLSTPAAAHCEAWYVGGGEVRTIRSSSAIPVPSTPADVASWTLLAQGVTTTGSEPVFTIAGLKLELLMQLTSENGVAVLIDTTAVSRQPGPAPTEVATLCF
jgi:prepilin-type N-terminal cleavage/methylation domain-containing protein